MTQNTSHAVMQQRHEPLDSRDDFPTPPWATRALIEHIIRRIAPDQDLKQQDCWEPAANRGYMVRPLQEYFAKVIASDIEDYGWLRECETFDFLAANNLYAPEWIITNPPFRLAADFARLAIERSTVGCAMLVRTSFLEGVDRFNRLFDRTPPAVVAQFVERVPMVRGRHDPEASTATSYAWLVWMPGARQTRFMWIPPCRRQFQRPGDAI